MKNILTSTTMCGQRTDNILYQDTSYHLATLPLDSYLKSLTDPFEFQSPDTGLQRGYEGTWEIRDNLLLLVNLGAYVNNYRKLDTGKLRIPIGGQIYHGSDYFESIFEFELVQKIEKGYFVGNKFKNIANKGRKKMLKETELQKYYPF